MFVIFYSVVYGFVVFFFFKQKTAYEMRISDWSSDVCSSDLGDRGQLLVGQDRVLLTRLRILEGERLGEAAIDGGGRRERAERGDVAAARAADARGLHPRGRRAATGLSAATRAGCQRDAGADAPVSSADRRVGRECGGTCR